MDGIRLNYSSGNSISRNNITNGLYGIRLDYSFDNIISGNDITNNWAGIELESASPYNSIYGNNITANMGDGIMLEDSNGNTISGNSIARNWCGINLPNFERDNVIYRNSLVENGVQVSYTAWFAVNIWDNGYPSGGNYWSDYNGNDSYCGLDQNEPGSDGIGDTPYAINENNSDHYPLMGPWTVQGENITVSPSSNITITFGNVTLEGVTSVNKTQTGRTIL
jgi:parallel beta-helix repeat protein